MTAARESGTEFILRILRTYPDRELRRGEFVGLCEGRVTEVNITKALYFLLDKGLIVRTKDGGEAWWAISAAGLQAAKSSPGQ